MAQTAPTAEAPINLPPYDQGTADAHRDWDTHEATAGLTATRRLARQLLGEPDTTAWVITDPYVQGYIDALNGLLASTRPGQ